MSIVVDDYPIILKRDADFWQDELEIVDTTLQTAVPLSDAELTIHPAGDLPEVVWNIANGKLSMPAPGTIRFTVSMEEIAAYEWSEGGYCLAITYTNGKRDFSFLTGTVEVRDVC